MLKWPLLSTKSIYSFLVFTLGKVASRLIGFTDGHMIHAHSRRFFAIYWQLTIYEDIITRELHLLVLGVIKKIPCQIFRLYLARSGSYSGEVFVIRNLWRKSLFAPTYLIHTSLDFSSTCFHCFIYLLYAAATLWSIIVLLSKEREKCFNWRHFVTWDG